MTEIRRKKAQTPSGFISLIRLILGKLKHRVTKWVWGEGYYYQSDDSLRALASAKEVYSKKNIAKILEVISENDSFNLPRLVNGPSVLRIKIFELLRCVYRLVNKVVKKMRRVISGNA